MKRNIILKKLAATTSALAMLTVLLVPQSIYALGWQTNPNPLPVATDQFTAVIYNDYLYTFGGTYTAGSIYYAPLNSDGTSDVWSLSSSTLPINRQRHSTVVANDHAYVIGGNAGGNAQSTVFAMPFNGDGSVGNGISTTPMTEGHRRHSSITANGFVYVFGSSNANFTKVIYAPLNPDGTVGAWVSGPDLPTNRYWSTAASYDGYVYLIGGYDTSALLNTVVSSKLNTDGSLGPWQTSTQNLPTDLMQHTSVVLGDYVFTFGGSQSLTGVPFSEAYVAQLLPDGATSEWEVLPLSLPMPLRFQALAQNSSHVYLVGGESNGVAQSSVYYIPSQELIDTADALFRPQVTNAVQTAQAPITNLASTGTNTQAIILLATTLIVLGSTTWLVKKFI